MALHIFFSGDVRSDRRAMAMYNSGRANMFLLSCCVLLVYSTALRIPPGCAFKIGASGAVGLVDCWLGFVLGILFSQNSSEILCRSNFVSNKSFFEMPFWKFCFDHVV